MYTVRLGNAKKQEEGPQGQVAERWMGRVSLYRAKSAIDQFPDPHTAPHSHLLCLVVPQGVREQDVLGRIDQLGIGEGVQEVAVLQPWEPMACYYVVVRTTTQEEADKVHQELNCKPFVPADSQYVLVLFLVDWGVVEGRELDPESLADSETEWLQLPACPWCLQRLDSSISGVIHTMCSHATNCDCISRSPCQVCQKLMHADQQCQECSSLSSVWCCLICGFLGCSRYNRMHAVDHEEEQRHRFSIDVETQRIWDYEADKYVHRLIHNHSEGRADFLPDSNETAGFEKEVADSKMDAKMDAMSGEYMHLLTCQLENQRAYYAEAIAKAGNREAVLALRARRRELEAECAEREESKRRNQEELEGKVAKLARLQKAIQERRESIANTQQSNAKVRLKAEGLKKEYEAHLLGGEHLRAGLKEKVASLREQIHDLEGHVNMQKRVKKQKGNRGVDMVNMQTSFFLPTEDPPAKKGYRKLRK